MNGFEKHGIDHLSSSSINLWINCPALWVAEKIFGHKRNPSPGMARGIAVEEAAVAALKDGVSIEDATISAVRNYNAKFLIGDTSVDKERGLIGPMVGHAVSALAHLGEPEFLDGGGQNKIELVCNCGDFKIPVIGYLDLFYPQHGKVVDIKSTQRIPSKMSPEHMLQRCIYARAKRNHSVEFLYVSTGRFVFLADGDVDAVLRRVKFHVVRLERFLQLEREHLREIVPVGDSSFYWNGSNALSEIYGLASPGSEVERFSIATG